MKDKILLSTIRTTVVSIAGIVLVNYVRGKPLEWTSVLIFIVIFAVVFYVIRGMVYGKA
jgi:uncharacterized spore protein YtfJ